LGPGVGEEIDRVDIGTGGEAGEQVGVPVQIAVEFVADLGCRDTGVIMRDLL
jgi:hypothetical protein